MVAADIAPVSSLLSFPAFFVRRVVGRGGLVVWVWYAFMYGCFITSLLVLRAFVGVLCMAMRTIQTALPFMG